MTPQPIKPPTVVKLTNQPKTVEAPLETVMKAKRENRDCPYTRSVYSQYIRTNEKTHAESDGNQRKAVLRDLAKDLRGLATDRKTVQDTRGRVQETVTGRKGTGENGGVDDMGEDMDSGTVDGDDVWAEGKKNEIQRQTKEVMERFTSERRYQLRATSLDRYRGRACR